MERAQAGLRSSLASAGVRVTGSTQYLLNAIFVETTPDRVAELRALPGVKSVVFLPRVRRSLNRAVPLVNGPAAWTALGGIQNAGLGIKIAIIDSGIDQTHPAFQDDSLPAPPGGVKCSGSDCAFTNKKVIAARSFVAQLAAGSAPNPAADSRPDDLSPRDHVGHGTALAMTAAGVTVTGPAATITGLAPKAYLGSYKIFGSPGVNDFTTGDVIIMALEQALQDGMDIAVLSLGSPAFSGPNDTGAICGETGANACDPEAQAVENATRAGMTVVVAAGNEGDIGQELPTRATIASPGTAPSAITVGASTNAHEFVHSVRLAGSDVPSNLQRILAQFGDGPLPASPVSAPLRDVTQLGNDGLACQPLPAGSLTNSFALIQRGTCTFALKARMASDAGATGVVFYLQQGQEDLFQPSGVAGTGVVAALIGYNEGQALKNFLGSHANYPVTLDPTLAESQNVTPDEIAEFSSRGPAIGLAALKPELVAVGTNMYMATERYDVNGDMYDPSGYVAASGTSFSTPMVAGAAALVKQRNPTFTPAQIKSAVVNTASATVTDSGSVASENAAGAGKLDAGKAASTTVTIEPATISFGALTSTALPPAKTLHFTNTGQSPVSLSLVVSARTSAPTTQVLLDTSNFSLNAGQARDVSVRLTGTVPPPGTYEGVIAVQGSTVPLQVPYMFAVGDGVAFDMFALSGDGFAGTVGQSVPDGLLAFKLIDQFGLPVAGAPVQFRVVRGGGVIQNPDSQTDANGIAAAQAILGSVPGVQQFQASAGGLRVSFTGSARPQPVIASQGVVNGASFSVGNGVAPGSYISIFGTGLSDETAAETTTTLPLSLLNVSVSFDVPSAGISVPGRMVFVSPNQVNVQVPWELRGQTSAFVKVTIGDSLGQVATVPISDYSPAIFEIGTSTNRVAAALDAGLNVITTGNPARRGQTISLFGNGFGPVSNGPASGDPAPAQPLAQTTATPAVTIGGMPANVRFSGLAPGFPGLYQLNVDVPANVATGVQPVAVTVNGIASRTVNLPIQ